ncbi:MAG: thioredoxin reductase [Miltoncostaeaceae bacterium]|nr:thioredoxin reductase [Miltoncostaeaceae bacterium]
MTTTRIKAEPFPDLADEALYPRFSEHKLEWLAERGERRSFDAGDVLYEQGMRDGPFFVIERGRVDFIDRHPGKEVWIAQADAGTFAGDIATFTGEPAMACCVAAERTDVIAFDRPGLRALLAASPEMGELVLGCLLARRAWHEGSGHGVLRLIAQRDCSRAFQVRDLLERNLVPLRVHDLDSDPMADKILDWLAIPREDAPLLIRNDKVMRNPSAAQVARDLGLRAEVDGQRFDMVVLGGGPAGLAAAVYAGSEGLRTFVAEAWGPGGQAGTSSRIENYLGFPSGISGAELTRAATLQARRFDAVLSSFHRAVEITHGPEGLTRVDLDDGQHVLARAVVIATGARWRELGIPGEERYRGSGLYHAAMPADAERYRDEDVLVVGGGNSAGQAATHLARHARSVRMVVRGRALSSTMSRYLVDRVETSPRIEVMTETEVTALHGRTAVDGVTLRTREGERRVDVSAVFAMIGAQPCTEAVTGLLAVDPAGYLLCGPGAASCDGRLCWPLGDRPPHLLETVRPGVFVAGDVRAGAANRVAGAVGDGAMATRFVHAVLDG